jgi:DNA-binding response OmpR family regulator
MAMNFASTLNDTGYEVVGPVHTAEAALGEAYRHRPDVALIDIGLRGWKSIAAVADHNIRFGTRKTQEIQNIGFRVTTFPIDFQALSGALDGLSVAAELTPLGVPVILLTGNYQRAVVEGRDLAADILIKPVSEIAILRSVASVLQPKPACGERRSPA